MNASFSTWMRRLDKRAPWPVLLAVGILILLGMQRLEVWLRARTAQARPTLESIAAARRDLDDEIDERQSLEALVASNLEHAKSDAAKLTRSRRVLFEGSLALAEEERLLAKQWEIMSTYVVVDQPADRVEVMHGDQIDQLLPLGGQRERAVDGDPNPLPLRATIVTKERYAHPDSQRGKSEFVDGRLDWEPPQVDASARARALGEYVLFTREGLIIHGPPLDKKAHEAYPHLCLTLPLATARKLYERTFIGTVVVIRPDAPSDKRRP